MNFAPTQTTTILVNKLPKTIKHSDVKTELERRALFKYVKNMTLKVITHATNHYTVKTTKCIL